MNVDRTLRPFVISRIFDTPRDLVWKAWTEREKQGWTGTFNQLTDYLVNH